MYAVVLHFFQQDFSFLIVQLVDQFLAGAVPAIQDDVQRIAYLPVFPVPGRRGGDGGFHPAGREKE